MALLEQAAVDPLLLESLSIRGYGAHWTAVVHVDKWIEQQRLGRNLWRLKHWELEGAGKRYRIVYALDPRVSRYYVLGVFTRDFNDDAADPRSQRVLALNGELDIPGYR